MVGYVLRHDILHGKVFLTINFVIDTVFEITYCLFPLLFLTNKNNIFEFTSLGLLGEQNSFIIIQSLFAIIMLVRKCILLMRDLNPTQIAHSHWIKITKHIKTDNLNSWINPNSLTKVKSLGFGHSELYRLVCARYEANDTIVPRTSLWTRMHQKDTNNTNANQSENGTTTIAASAGLVTNLANSRPAIRLQPSENVSKSLDGDFELESPNSNVSNTNEIQNQKQQEKGGMQTTSMNLNQTISAVDKYAGWQGKVIILCSGFSFVLIGVLILAFFVSFIDNDYKNKCFENDNSMQLWFEENPELKYYDEYCATKVINIFDDYPCNCRFLSIEISDDDDNPLEPKILEKSMMRYNDLQGIFVDAASNGSVYFSKEMFEDLVCFCFIYSIHVGSSAHAFRFIF